MTKYKPLDDRDRAALARLDNGFSDNGELAMVSGEMTVEVVRAPHVNGDQLWMTIHFPGGEAFDVKILRAGLLEQLKIDNA